MSAAEAAIMAMLRERGAGKTLCPSEVARALAGPDGDWRGQMAEVHASVDRLAAEGRIALSWKGASLALRDGPYRIGPSE